MSNNKIDEEVEYPKERHRTTDYIGVFKVMEGEVAVKTEPKPTEMIIETILTTTKRPRVGKVAIGRFVLVVSKDRR